MVTMGKHNKISFDVLNILLLMLVTTVVRMVVFTGQKYFMNIDTYAYLSFISSGINKNIEFMRFAGSYLGITGMLFFLMSISILTTGLFYILVRRYVKDLNASFIASFMFAVSPMVFFNNQFGIIDKNVLTLFMIILIMLLMTIKNNTKRIIALIPAFSFFAYVWHGWYGMLVLVFIYYVIDGIIAKNKLSWFVGFIGIVIGMIFGYDKFKGITIPSDWHLISELNPIWNIGLLSEYLIIVIVWILMFTMIRTTKHDIVSVRKYLFLYVGTIVMFFYMCFIFRINIFFWGFLYLWVGIFYEKLEYAWKYKYLSAILIVLFVMLTSTNMYFREPVMNDGIMETVNYINTLNTTCIINVWSLGHIYDYYTDKEVYFKASAGTFKNQLDIMVWHNINTYDKCTIVWSDTDVDALAFMIAYLKNDTKREDYYINKIDYDWNTSYHNISYYVFNGGK